ncbi:MAG: hypothetical protein KF774_17770 [Planctomyces sp.]|nr:hypothetical protein [Planctomyces sp.]
MATFRDAAGDEWTLSVTVGLIRRVQAATGHKLLELVEDGSPLLRAIEADELVAFDLLAAAVASQRDAAGVSVDQFAERLNEQALTDGFRALLEATIDFFPEPKRRPLRTAMRRSYEALDRLQAELLERAAYQADSQSAAAAIDASLREKLGVSSGSSPASPASIPKD